jgi:phosphomannomutase
MRWIADDPDGDDRAELQRVLAQAMAGTPGAAEELAQRLAGPLRFGTAGLRGAVRAGPNGMNTAVVLRTTAGLASWLTRHGHAGGVVVVGRDARHGSQRFAAAAAGVLAAAGFDVRVLPGPLPTPVTAFAVRRLAAVAGVQVTASHNPPADNGYKVYLDAGAQLVPPADTEIEAAIAAAPPACSIPAGGGWTVVGDDLIESYVDSAAAVARRAVPSPPVAVPGLVDGASPGTADAPGLVSTVSPKVGHGVSGQRTHGVGTADTPLRVVATPMHGVGGRTLRAALRRAGFTDLYEVAEQLEPDPDFPTVSFPNPEEPGAVDLLLALAADRAADLAIALDPDADRCALGVPEPGPGGRWRMLRGDETGVLLGRHVLANLDRARHPDPLVATTIVSSSLLGEVAREYGARYDETLTGFKWIVRAGDGRGTGLVFGYEEALGLCVDPDVVRDKDGISAAVLACDLAARAKSAGRTLLDELDAVALRHGVHLTEPVTVTLAEPGAAAMARVRAALPSTLDGRPVRAEDLLPRTDGVRLTGDGVRVVVRPSGTEPKLKAYLQVVEPVTASLADAKQAAATRMVTLRTAVAALLHCD